jgi:hypothetical protein
MAAIGALQSVADDCGNLNCASTKRARTSPLGWPWFYIGGNQDPRHAGEEAALGTKDCRPKAVQSTLFAPPRFAQPGALDEQAPEEFSISVLSRQKKNPSTISRSRSLASCAERRVVLGIGSNVSKAARTPAAWRRNCPYRGQCRADASTLAQWIGDPVKRRLTIGAEAPSRITEPLPSLICRRGWAPLRSVSRAGDQTANICARQNAR